jgi:hypothetical protein
MMRRLYTIGTVFLGILAVFGQDHAKDVQPFLQKFCIKCHGGKKVKGKVDFTKMKTDADLTAAFETWATAIDLLKEGEMPPDAAKQPSAADMEVVFKWYQKQFVESVEAQPGHFRARRLSAREYRNTLRSLFGFDLEVAVIEAEQTEVEKSLVMKLMPTDPPGKSGFENDTHANPLTSMIWDQYSYLADQALDRLFSPVRRKQLLVYTGPIPPAGLTAENAERLLRSFLPRVQRRSLDPKVVGAALERVRAGANLEATLKREMKSALVSPTFIYRGLLMTGERERQRPVDEFELAERLSYFLWGDMPDDDLLKLAGEGGLRGKLPEQIDRMIKSTRVRNLSEDFTIQWLALDSMNQFTSRELTLAVALKTQPVEFLHYLITENRPLMELIDSQVTYANPLLAKFYRNERKQLAGYRKAKGIEKEIVPHTRIRLENTKGRGGLLTMPGILAMNRGPVQRGTWMLERILGVHLPEPPPDVGQVEPNRNGEKLSFRQRFERHRSNPTCAVCHNKIDPLGFALQRYTDDGSYRGADNFTESKKKNKGTDYGSGEIDTSGRLPGGETFNDFPELKRLLLSSQREDIIRNIVKQMLAYALCRKLEIFDQPTVEQIVKRLNERNGTWRDLIHEIVDSLPFQETVVKGTKS